MADLFELDDLRKALQLPVDQFDTDAATVARRHASGWLMSPTGLTTWPTPVPDNLWAWAVELAAIAYRNPAGAASERVDDYEVRHDAQRRLQILDEAAATYGGGRSPQYQFPEWDWHWKTPGASVITS